MADDQIFIDTNILVYAHDIEAGVRHTIARERVTELWRRSLAPALSVQVLQELYVNLIRKDVGQPEAQQTITDYGTWNVVNNDQTLLLEGIALQARWQTSFWDALILAAAVRAKANIIWSEDFSTSQVYEGIVVVNPLL